MESTPFHLNKLNEIYEKEKSLYEKNKGSYINDMENKIKELEKNGFQVQTKKAKVVGKYDVICNFDKTKKYIYKYFYTMNDGSYYFWDGKEFVYYTYDVMRRVYINRFPKEITKWFLVDNKKFYQVINHPLKPRIIDSDDIEKINYLNVCAGFKHKVKPYASYSSKIKAAVDKMLFHVLDVLCNGCVDQKDYIISWFSNMIKGNKNISCLYFKGIEGIGKSTLTDFVYDHVLGESVCQQLNDASVIKTENNSILAGKMLVIFEELPTFSESEWSGVSGRLKYMITGKNLTFCDKYIKKWTGDNINNYVLNTNVDAIKNSEGRRYVILDVSTKMLGNVKYFDDIRDICFNDEVGEAFYNYLLEIDTSDFKSNVFPETDNKLDAIAERLHPFYKFIKEKYILKHSGIDSKLKDIVTDYSEYCDDNKKKMLTNIALNKKFAEIGIKSYISNGVNKIKISKEELLGIAKKLKWIHELDEFKNNNNEEDDIETLDMATYERLKNKIKELENEIKRLKNSKALEQNIDSDSEPEEELPKKKVIPKIDSDPESDTETDISIQFNKTKDYFIDDSDSDSDYESESEIIRIDSDDSDFNSDSDDPDDSDGESAKCVIKMFGNIEKNQKNK